MAIKITPNRFRIYRNEIPVVRQRRNCNLGYDAVPVFKTIQETITDSGFICDPTLYVERGYQNVRIEYRARVNPILGPNRKILGSKSIQKRQVISYQIIEGCDIQIIDFQDLVNQFIAYKNAIPEKPPPRKYTLNDNVDYIYYQTKNFVYSDDKLTQIESISEIQEKFSVDINCNQIDGFISNFNFVVDFVNLEFRQTTIKTIYTEI